MKYIRSASVSDAASQMIAELRTYKGTIFERVTNRAIQDLQDDVRYYYDFYRHLDILTSLEIAEVVADKFESITGVQLHASIDGKIGMPSTCHLELYFPHRGCNIYATDSVDEALDRLLSTFDSVIKARYKTVCEKKGMITPVEYADVAASASDSLSEAIQDVSAFKAYCQKILKHTYNRNRPK